MRAWCPNHWSERETNQFFPGLELHAAALAFFECVTEHDWVRPDRIVDASAIFLYGGIWGSVTVGTRGVSQIVGLRTRARARRVSRREMLLFYFATTRSHRRASERGACFRVGSINSILFTHSMPKTVYRKSSRVRLSSITSSHQRLKTTQMQQLKWKHFPCVPVF